MQKKNEARQKEELEADVDDEEEDAASFVDYADLDVQQVKVEAPSRPAGAVD